MDIKKIRFDRTRCMACAACAVACMNEKNTDIEKGERALRQVYTEEICREGKVRFRFHSDSCLHCRPQLCVGACERGCLYRDPGSGLVLYDTGACDGCGLCIRACPMQAISLDKNGKIQKCDGCVVRQRRGQLPACVQVCPTGALGLETGHGSP